MFDRAYICTNNHNLAEIETSISVSWKTKYIGRKIIPEKYYELFDHNGYDFENDQYDMWGITANIKPIVDSEGYIVGIDGYKVKYNSDGPRPDTDHKAFSKRDISHFSKVLDSVTEDPINLQYDELKSVLKKGQVLAGGFRVKGITSTGITLVSPIGEERKLMKAGIISALTISHSYIDVLFCPEIMKQIPGIIAAEEIPYYIALFSIIDFSSYRNYTKLFEEANNRALLRDASSGYPALVSAVEDNDSTSVSKHIKYAPIVIIDQEYAHEPPIVTAVRNNNTSIVRLLLEGGTYSKESYLDQNNKSVSALRIAIENQNYDLINLLCQYHGAQEDTIDTSCYTYFPTPQASFRMSEIFTLIGEKQDYKALKTILPFVAQGTKKESFNPLLFSDLKDGDIDFMVSIPGAAICWPLSIAKNTYYEDRDKCVNMISQGCDVEAIDFFIEENDVELFSIALSHHRFSYARESFHSVFERGGEWYNALQKAYTSPFCFEQDRDIYLQKLIRAEKYNAAKAAIEKMGISFPVKALDAFIRYPSEKAGTKEAQDFFRYIVNTCKYTENTGDGSTYDSSFHFFTDALICYAETDTVKEFLKKFPLRITQNDKCFMKELVNMIEYRADDLFAELIKLRLEYDASKSVPEYFTEYFGFSDYRQKTVFELFELIISKYARNENPSKYYVWSSDSERNANLASRWAEALHQLLMIVSTEELDSTVSIRKYKGFANANTALEYAQSAGIMSIEVLSQLTPKA